MNSNNNKNEDNSNCIITDINDNNALYSPVFAEYLLNNWCGLLPLWTSLHLGDQGRHGDTEVYEQWSNKFSQLDCVKDPPKTQGIIEFHQKSVKHIAMNSKRDRLDEVIRSLYISKKSKLRQLEICKSRQKVSLPEDKVKNTVPSKIVVEKWGKKKQYKGPGYYQQNKKPEKDKKNESLEEWERLPAIPWGGNYVLPTGETLQLYDTCAIDTFLQILFVFYSLNIHQMRKLFDAEDSLVEKICNVVQLLLTHEFNAAKFDWFTKIYGVSLEGSDSLNMFGTDKQLIMYQIKNIFQRTYDFFCSSNKCPSNIVNICPKNDTVDDMTLHHDIPDLADKTSVQKSIEMWELGTSSKAAISCKEAFASEPDHSEFISEIDNGEEVVRCSGWRQPLRMSFVVPPPFLVFDISIVFRDQVKTLDVLPLEICVYNEKYKLGGITSYVEDRRHYVGYVVNENYFLFYDGLPSAKPVLKKHVGNHLDGDVSLLIYFPCDQIATPAGKPQAVTKETCSSVPIEDEEVNKVKSTSRCNQKKRSFGLRKDPKKKKYSRKSWVSEGVDEELSEDFLLAQALDKIENEVENVYERPKWKNYRLFRKPSSNGVVKTKKGKFFHELDSYLHSSSSSSVSDNENEECEPEINTELINFISKRKDFILKVISDPDCRSEYHLRSERLVAFHNCRSLKTCIADNMVPSDAVLPGQHTERCTDRC